MKKFLIALLSVMLCVTCAVSLAACGKDDTHNADGTPKNMAETIIDFDNGSNRANNLFVWADYGNKANSTLPVGTVRTAVDGETGYDKYGGFTFCWKKGSKYKITKLEFDITSQTSFTIEVDCSFSDSVAGAGEYKHLDTLSIGNGQIVHIAFDNLNVGYSKYTQTVAFKNNGVTTDKSVLNWQIKISNLFITAEKV